MAGSRSARLRSTGEDGDPVGPDHDLRAAGRRRPGRGTRAARPSWASTSVPPVGRCSAAPSRRVRTSSMAPSTSFGTLRSWARRVAPSAAKVPVEEHVGGGGGGGEGDDPDVPAARGGVGDEAVEGGQALGHQGGRPTGVGHVEGGVEGGRPVGHSRSATCSGRSPVQRAGRGQGGQARGDQHTPPRQRGDALGRHLGSFRWVPGVRLGALAVVAPTACRSGPGGPSSRPPPGPFRSTVPRRASHVPHSFDRTLEAVKCPAPFIEKLLDLQLSIGG